MSKKVHILTDKVNNETRVIAVATPESFLPFILEFNSVTNIQLKPGIPLQANIKDTSFSFSQAEVTIQESTHILLLKNKQDGQILMKEAKTFDYLIIIRGENCSLLQSQLISKLKPLPHIALVTSFEANLLKALNKIFPSVS